MYQADNARYNGMQYRRCGKSGILLPAISLGLWHNFGTDSDANTRRQILCAAFDAGITHFDLANNYGPVYGAAEENFGKVVQTDFKPYRDELFISTKAGWDMWAGPYGDHGSRKYLIASLDQSLKRMKLDYVDLFYHHRPDPETPMEETAVALDSIVKQGKALYVGISSYNPEQTRVMTKLLRELHTPFIIHQPRYNMFTREAENGLTDALDECGLGAICFSPLAQGLLTDRYLNGIPSDSRANQHRFLKESDVERTLDKVKQLATVARERGQSLAQMALSWNLRLPQMTSVLIGASRVSQLRDNLGALNNLTFSREELERIDKILA